MPGKSLYTADTLFKVPLNEITDKPSVSSGETEHFMKAITTGLPANADCLKAHDYANDKTCSQLCNL